MLEPGRDLDLAEEALGAQAQRELGMEHLEGDRTMVAAVLGQEDRGHAAAPHLALDVVALGEPGPEAALEIVHGEGPKIPVIPVPGEGRPL